MSCLWQLPIKSHTFKCAEESQLEILDRFQANLDQKAKGPHLLNNAVIGKCSVQFRKNERWFFLMGEFECFSLIKEIYVQINQYILNAFGSRSLTLGQVVIWVIIHDVTYIFKLDIYLLFIKLILIVSLIWKIMTFLLIV